MQRSLKTFRFALMLVFSLIVGTVSAQTIKGNVVDETGEAVIGATVMEKGTKNAVVTDFEGNFTIKMGNGKALVISYIGMQTQEVNVAGKTSINVVLKEDATTLQDVVVVGYGTMKKTDLTGSISSVDTEKDKEQIKVEKKKVKKKKRNYTELLQDTLLEHIGEPKKKIKGRV